MIADYTIKQIGVTERNKINTLKEVKLIISNPSIHMYNPQKKKIPTIKRNEIEFGPYQHSTQYAQKINNRRCKIKVSPFFLANLLIQKAKYKHITK